MSNNIVTSWKWMHFNDLFIYHSNACLCALTISIDLWPILWLRRKIRKFSRLVLSFWLIWWSTDALWTTSKDDILFGLIQFFQVEWQWRNWNSDSYFYSKRTQFSRKITKKSKKNHSVAPYDTKEEILKLRF